MKIQILRGLPGSGKTTYAKRFSPAIIVSADDYFLVNGVYQFDPRYLPQAHAWCLRSFVSQVTKFSHDRPDQFLFVDNTNISVEEMAGTWR